MFCVYFTFLNYLALFLFLRVVKFTAKMMSKALAKRQKAIILYATETGKSERYAKMLGDLFSYAFDPKVRTLYAV